MAHVRQELALEFRAVEGVVARFGELILDLLALDDLLMQHAVGLGELRRPFAHPALEFFLGAAHDFLRLHLLGDVRAGADPFPDPAVRFEHRHAARGEVPVGAVDHLELVLGLEDGLGLERPLPKVGRALAVIQVDGIEPAVSSGPPGTFDRWPPAIPAGRP